MILLEHIIIIPFHVFDMHVHTILYALSHPQLLITLQFPVLCSVSIVQVFYEE